MGPKMCVRMPWSLAALLAALVVLAACSSPPPKFAVSAVSPSSGGYADLLTVGVTAGDADTVLEVCGEALDTSFVAGTYTSGGTTYPARLTAAAPLRPTGVTCDVVARKALESAAAGAFAYVRPAVAGRSLLVYARISTVDDAATLLTEVLDDLDDAGVNITRVATNADFVTALGLVDFDAVVWIEELGNLLTEGAVDAITDHIADGGATWFTYWLLYNAAETAVPEARTAFGLSDVTNVTPVVGGSIDATMSGGMALGLDDPTVALENIHYAQSYASRLVPGLGATSSCTYADVTGGSCAVVANGGRSLVTGFTLATLIHGAGVDTARKVLENGLAMILLP